MFNVHHNKTSNGVVITPNLRVLDYDFNEGTVISDDNDRDFGCCAPTDSHDESAHREDYLEDQLHPSGQKNHSGVWIETTEGAECPPSTGGYASCRHDHWFTVQTPNGTKSFNGSRLKAI